MAKGLRFTEAQLAAMKARNSGKVAPQSAKTKMQALGRLKTGEMNKTELAYEAHLFAAKVAGEVAWYKFEGIKFRLADNTFYTPDFAVMLANGEMQLHEVKGSLQYIQDDAMVKIKVASDIYPFQFFLIAPKSKKDGGGWVIKKVK